MKCIDHIVLLGIGYEAWLICDNEDASKRFVAIENLVFDFELFIGVCFVRWPKVITVQIVASMTL